MYCQSSLNSKNSPKNIKEKKVRRSLSLKDFKQNRPVENPAQSWIPQLDLKFKDKVDIETGAELGDKVMYAINKLLQHQYRDINGFQDTILVPKLQNKKSCESWLYQDQKKMFESRAGPCAQIHHNGKQHWVFSFSFKNSITKSTASQKVTVYLMDSFYHDEVSPSLQIQLAKLYGYECDSLVVTIPVLQQQKLGPNCGLFAIAHMVEYCNGQYEKIDNNTVHKEFDEKLMRKHLSKCLEAQALTPFPKVTVNNYQPTVYHLPICLFPHCCSLPEVYADMIQCDRCQKWYHKICRNVKGETKTWECSQLCQGKRHRKKKQIFTPDR